MITADPPTPSTSTATSSATVLPSPSAAVVPAGKVSTGGAGFLVFFFIAVGVVVLGLALRGSLRRLRQQSDAGTFGRPRRP